MYVYVHMYGYMYYISYFYCEPYKNIHFHYTCSKLSINLSDVLKLYITREYRFPVVSQRTWYILPQSLCFNESDTVPVFTVFTVSHVPQVT